MGIRQCRLKECPLIRKGEVPYSGNTKARIVGIGESPGREEESAEYPQPFIGKAGRLIKKICREVGINWNNLFVMNSSRCRIFKNDMSQKEITLTLKLCRRYVTAALGHVKPDLIICWGDFAMKQIIKKSGITKARGKWVWSDEFGCWVLPMYHPAYILRNPSLREVLVSDMRKVVQFIKEGYAVKQDIDEEGYREVTDLRDVLVDGDSIALDTETQGLDWQSPNFVPISASVSPKEGVAYNVTFFEETPEGGEPDFFIEWPRLEGRKKVPTRVPVSRSENFDQKVEGLVWAVENQTIKKYMHHGNFDRHVLGRLFQMAEVGHSVTMRAYVMDTQAAANVLDENLFKLPSLEMIQQFFTNFDADYNYQFAMKYGKADMLAVPASERMVYACADADVTRRGAIKIREKLLKEKKMARYYVKAVHPSLEFMLYELEENGAWIDPKALPETTKEVERLKNREEREATRFIPKKVKELKLHREKGIKLTRNDLVRDAMFSTSVGFGLPVLKETKSKQPSMDKEVRKMLLDKRIKKRARQFIEHYNEWSELHTLHSRYLKGFRKHIRSDARIHSSYSLSTVTGRVASMDPNMMNNPKRSKSAKMIRKLIAAPKGWLLMTADESQSELRWAAHVAKSKTMGRVFRTGADIHTNTAISMVEGRPNPRQTPVWDALDAKGHKDRRQKAKPVNFGMLFLMSPPGLVKYAKLEYGVEMSVDEAERYIKLWFGTYPELKSYHEETIDFARRHGYVDSPLGRRRRLPEINSDDKYLRLEAERMAVNHPIQNPSSDVVLMAGNELISKELLNPDEAFAILFIHDELVFQVRDNSKVEDTAKIIRHAMENPPLERDLGVKLSVPLVSEVEVGPNLAETTLLAA